MTNSTGKWPEWLTYIRHARSAYNSLKDKRRQTELYKRFLHSYELWEPSLYQPAPKHLIDWAEKVTKQFALTTGDHDTVLDENAGCQAEEMARNLSKMIALPDVILVSPYFRTLETLRYMKRGWPELEFVEVIEEERIREQEHGVATAFNDWKAYTVFDPLQYFLYKSHGPYWYRFPQGENVPDVRARDRSFRDKLIRDYGGKKVMCITHHLNILSSLANGERWGAADFIKKDSMDKPINCGVTQYIFDPKAGESGQGKLVLDSYNKCLYTV
jgi:broad specificity phosphatase PhoE